MTQLAAPRAELELLWVMLTGSRAVRDDVLVDHAIGDRHFADPAHQALFAAIVAAHDAGAQGELSVAAIAPAVKDDPRCTPDTAQQALRDLANAFCAVSDVRTHLRSLKDLEHRRRLEHAAGLLMRGAQEGDPELIDQANRLIDERTAADQDTADPVRLADLIGDYLQTEGDVGFTTGLPALDRATGGGLRPGDTSAIGAWTGFGKSAMVDGWLELHAHKGRKVHAYVNEMSFVDRGLRMVASMTRVPYGRLSTRRFKDGDSDRILAALNSLPFGVTDCSTWDAQRIARDIKARRWDLCCLDVLHNIPYQNTSHLDEIILTLAAAARSAGTHLILVCQFNQERSKDEIQPKPVLRDIRGSGTIKNLCASVMLLHRQQTVTDGVVLLEPEGLVYDAKHRHGPGGGCEVRFDARRMRFTELMAQAPSHYERTAA